MSMLNQPTPTLPANLMGDVAAGTTLFGVVMNHFWSVLPTIVTVTGGTLAILWYCIQVWESKTVQQWNMRRLSRVKVKKIAKLKAKGIVISAELEALELRRAAAVTASELVATASADAKQRVAEATTQQALAEVASPAQKIDAPAGIQLDLDAAVTPKH